MGKRSLICVLLDRGFGSFREILRGISRVAISEMDWHLEFVYPTEDFAKRIAEIKPDGLILGWVDGAQNVRRAIRAAGHTVGVCGQFERLGIKNIPQVESADELVGELAAKHFLQKGYTHFAFVGSEYLWSHRRRIGFERAVKKAGYHVDFEVFEENWNQTGGDFQRPHYSADIAAWLKSLPKPLAILACCDHRAIDVTTTCRDAGIDVPDQIAVLGVDDDDLDCELSHPPLSSVRVPWRRIGETTANLLKKQLDGETVKPQVYGVSPVAVIERQSTSTLAISDPDLNSAIQFIRLHAHESISVDDVMENISISRRSMESKFRKLLGRTPLEEIRRVRIDLAKQMLAGTELAMSDVARRCGFSDSARFSRVFLESAGSNPTEYRREHRR